MQIAVVTDEAQRGDADALVVGVTEGGAVGLAGAAGAAAAAAQAAGDFTGKSGQTLVLYPGDGGPKRLILTGLGPAADLTPEAIRKATGRAVRRAADLGAHSVSAALLGSDPLADAEAMAEAAVLAAYRFDRYHTLDADERAAKRVDAFTIVAPAGADSEALGRAAATGQAIAEGTLCARDLVSAPPNELTPTEFGARARRLAEELGLRCTVLDRAAMQEHRMGAILGVAQGSQEPPAFIIVEYEPAGGATDTVVFVGKGITFDSGGLQIKTSDGMARMKTDMGGAAAVLGALRAVGALKPAQRVVGLIAATENMPSGTAFRPGDVLTSMAGITIEILSTDAEGRLVLADALHWAKRYQPAAVIDLATLTGSAAIALGAEAAAAFTNDEALVRRLAAAGETTGERIWHMPLWREYHDLIKSDIADVKNTGGRQGGAQAGAALLEKFVDYPWVHLDIAGMAWTERERPYTPKGATGYGVRLLTQFLRHWGTA